MDTHEVSDVLSRVSTLIAQRYLDAGVGADIARLLAKRLASGGYPGDERALAAAVTADLQSVNGDRHLRLLYHEEPLPDRADDDDAEEYAAMTRWADRTCGGVGRVERLAGNVGYLDLRPLLFPSVITGGAIAAAMTLIAPTAALVIDVRNCLGGEPSTVALLISYLYGPEPVELSGLYERTTDRLTQRWTTPFVPGRKFGPTKPVYVLTSAATFSGGENLAYDLQQSARATVLGERTRGGAHPRIAFRVHPHLELTVSIARSVHPLTGSNWEGTGVVPDVEVPAAEALDRAYRLALVQLAAGPDTETATEARRELAAAAAPRDGAQ